MGPATEMPAPLRWAEWRIGAPISVAAIGIRVWLSGTLYLNPDEALQLNAASSHLWNATYHPPILLWWLWLVSQVGEKEWWLRLLPCVAGGLAPAATAIWLRRFVSPMATWSIAAILAFSPVLVYLTLQLRGYSLAMLAAPLAFAALDLAFAETSVTALAGHFAALYIGILAEFSMAWIALAAGVYGLALLARTSQKRRFILAWIGGQAGAALIYLWLYVHFVRPLLGQPHAAVSFLDPYLFQKGRNPAAFAFRGFISQFRYITGGAVQGWIAAAFFAVGTYSWTRTRDLRAIVVVVPYAVALAGFAGLFPFGPTRHTVVIGVVSLAAVGVGIDVATRGVRALKLCAILALLLPAFVRPGTDPMNIPAERWQKEGWEDSLEVLRQTVPPGSIVVTSGAVRDMLVAYRLPPRQRNIGVTYADRFASPVVDGFRLLVFGYFYHDLSDPNVQSELWKRVYEVRRAHPETPRTIWFLNGGWEVSHFPPGQTLIDGPGIYLAHLDQ